MGFLAVGAFSANAINAFATGAAVVGAGAAGIGAALGKVEALFLAVSVTFFSLLSASSLKESIDARRTSKHMPQEEGLQVKQETHSKTLGFRLPDWKGLTPNQAAASLIGAGSLVIAAGSVMMTSALSGGPLIIAAGALYAAWGSMFLQNPFQKKEQKTDMSETATAAMQAQPHDNHHHHALSELKGKASSSIDMKSLEKSVKELLNRTEPVRNIPSSPQLSR